MKIYNKIILSVFFCMILGGMLTYKYIKYSMMKTTDVLFIRNAYHSYLGWYYEFPNSQDDFKRFMISYAFDMSQSITFIKNNPLLDNTITFIQYNDTIQRIRATLSPIPKSHDDLINNAVPIEDYNFFHFLINSKAIVLFDYPAYKCNGRRNLMIFYGTEPIRCFDEKSEKVTWILKGFYKEYNELVDLAQGSQSSCYHIRATKKDSTFEFSVECLPHDSMWIDQKGLEVILDSLAKSFTVPELEYVDHFFFPLIAKKSTLQQRKNIEIQLPD